MTLRDFQYVCLYVYKYNIIFTKKMKNYNNNISIYYIFILIYIYLIFLKAIRIIVGTIFFLYVICETLSFSIYFPLYRLIGRL